MALSYKWFRYPFASAGDVAAIPDTVQGDGSVSYPQGYGPDYALDPATQPAALNIERTKNNQLYLDITTALQWLQAGNPPQWIGAADNGGTNYSYAINARVLYTDGIVYRSLVAANTTVPGTDPTKWTPEQMSQYWTATGTGNAQVLTPVVAIPAYVGGQTFKFIPVAANTGAVTVNVSGLGVKSIVRPDGSALLPGDIPAAGLVEIIYQATLGKFILNSMVTQQGSGYVRIPGSGIIIQWVNYSLTPTQTTNCPSGSVWGTASVVWPIAFPNSCITAIPATTVTNNGQYNFASMAARTQTGADVYHNTWNTATTPVTGTVIAIGN